MNLPFSSRSTIWISLFVFGALIVVVAIAANARAANVELGQDFAITGAGSPASTWNPDIGDACGVPNDSYTPVSEGEVYRPTGTSHDDAFDDGLLLGIGGTGMEANVNDLGDDYVNAVSTSFGQGTELFGNLSGLKVTRTDAVQAKGAAIMRSVIRLKNGGNKKSSFLTWTSDLGSDGSTGIRRTSSGDTNLTKSDRWVVSSDTPGSGLTGDATVTHVFRGPNKSKGISSVDPDCKLDPGDADLSVRFNFSVPKKSTKYFVFFTELHFRNDQAIKRAKYFNRPKKYKKLFKGMSSSQKKNTLNWDL